jgi:hypothetical protein
VGHEALRRARQTLKPLANYLLDTIADTGWLVKGMV